VPKCPAEFNLEDENDGFDCTIRCDLDLEHDLPHVKHGKGRRAFFIVWWGDDRDFKEGDIPNHDDTYCHYTVEDWEEFWLKKLQEMKAL
jgi:hypothetical protein